MSTTRSLINDYLWGVCTVTGSVNPIQDFFILATIAHLNIGLCSSVVKIL